MKFVMSRDRVVVTKLGRSYGFTKGEPLHVPPECWDDVIGVGGVPEEELPVPDESVPTVPQGAERAKIILESIKKMVLKAERGSFTASGAPNAGVLSGLAGFAVEAKERDQAWAAAQTEQG